MEFRVRLVHADAHQRVVLVRAFRGDRCLGSALGEGASAEEAEDRAIDRLRRRLVADPAPFPGPSSPAPIPAPGAAVRPPVPPPVRVAAVLESSVPEPPVPAPPPDSGPTQDAPAPSAVDPLDPEDWSADLTQLDHRLRTLGWGRDQEQTYLQRLFGHPSRSRLTDYADLLLLRRALEGVTPGSAPEEAPLPLRRSDLIAQCDSLLAQLGWNTERARQCLEEQFSVTSRQLLRDEQLLAFNLLLEGQMLGMGREALPPTPA